VFINNVWESSSFGMRQMVSSKSYVSIRIFVIAKVIVLALFCLCLFLFFYFLYPGNMKLYPEVEKTNGFLN